MKKFYQEPDVELIRLVPQDKITNDKIETEGGSMSSWFD